MIGWDLKSRRSPYNVSTSSTINGNLIERGIRIAYKVYVLKKVKEEIRD